MITRCKPIERIRLLQNREKTARKRLGNLTTRTKPFERDKRS